MPWTRRSIAVTGTTAATRPSRAGSPPKVSRAGTTPRHPALVAKQLLEGVLEHDVSPRYARFLNNATHWGFGLAAGGGYGLLLGSRRTPKVWYGLPFGAAVWASGYVVLPLFGVYEPIWKYDLKTLAKDLSAHLVFGVATAAAFSALDRKESP